MTKTWGLLMDGRSVPMFLAAACLAACGGATVEKGLILDDPVHHIDVLCREPMLVEHPNGSLFVAGFGSQITGVDPDAPPNLWRSDDRGQTWRRVDVGSTADGARGNSDVDLAVAPDGTLYFVPMGFDRSAKEGTHIAVGVSRDEGETWEWSTLSEDRYDDRPWVAVAPDGTAHVVWNDGSGVSHAVSADGGRSWAERKKVHPVGGSSHLAVGPGGEVAVRITPLSASGNRYDEGVDLIAVSVDGGLSWRKNEAPGSRQWDPTFSDPDTVPRWVEPLAWDADGALFYLWSSGNNLFLARSRDLGASWSAWTLADDDEAAFFPYLAARGSGELAATWFSGSGDGLAAHIARIEVPDDDVGELKVHRSRPVQPDSWSEAGDPRVRDTAGEYIPVAFLSDGGLGVVTAVQDPEDDRYGFSWWRIQPD
jgi:hypothetical protein